MSKYILKEDKNKVFDFNRGGILRPLCELKNVLAIIQYQKSFQHFIVISFNIKVPPGIISTIRLICFRKNGDVLIF